MKVSVITVCYNSAKTIEDTIVSVLNQDYPEIEYIIVDGKSSDETLIILEKYKSKITKIISEKDNGIYYAINKGIALSTGDIVAILNSDDFYVDSTVISAVVNTFLENNVEAVYGDLQYIAANNKNKIIRTWHSKKYEDNLFLKGWMPPHPSFFILKKCYDSFGTYNTSLKISADYELMLRMLYKEKITSSYIPKLLVKMRVGGESNRFLLSRIIANVEDRKSWKINNLTPDFLTLIIKPLSKIKQFFE